jgi:hypothetical protein
LKALLFKPERGYNVEKETFQGEEEASAPIKNKNQEPDLRLNTPII